MVQRQPYGTAQFVSWIKESTPDMTAVEVSDMKNAWSTKVLWCFSSLFGSSRYSMTAREDGPMQPPHRKYVSHMASFLLFHNACIAVEM